MSGCLERQVRPLSKMGTDDERETCQERVACNAMQTILPIYFAI
jgi:hypothetical protein